MIKIKGLAVMVTASFLFYFRTEVREKYKVCYEKVESGACGFTPYDVPGIDWPMTT